MPTAAQLHSYKKPPGMGKLDLRDLLLLGGAGQYTALMSINYMNYLPGTCEPYAQGVIQIVKGLQRLLNARGAALQVDGGMGDATQKALQKFAGPRWYEKSWAQLYLDVIQGDRWKGVSRPDRSGIEKDAATNQLMQGMGDDYALPRPRAVKDRFNFPNWIDPVRPKPIWNPRPRYALGATSGAGWELRGGVAIPLTAAMLVSFQSIQRAINAINAKQGRALVDVDGRLGPKTIEALSTIVYKNGTDPWASTTVTPTFVADNVAEISDELKSLMGHVGATYVPDPKPTSAPSTVKTDGTINNPPDSTSTTTLVIAAIAIGGAVALIAKKRKKR